MKDIVEIAIAVIYSGALLLGGGYGLKTIHDEVKKAARTKVSKGLSSSESLANALTGEKTGFLKTKALGVSKGLLEIRKASIVTRVIRTKFYYQEALLFLIFVLLEKSPLQFINTYWGAEYKSAKII